MASARPCAHGRPNAVALKAIWLDIDCNKEPPKGYRSKEDGLKALIAFCKATGTPFPTAIIDSGNGLHVYWISDKPLSVKTGERTPRDCTRSPRSMDCCTTPSPRTRCASFALPGTSNKKQDPPKPVVIKLLEADISFTSELKCLLEAKPVSALKRVADIAVVDEAALKGGPAKAFEETTTEKLGEGIERTEYPPVPFAPIKNGCGLFADAHATGGKEHAQPLWHLEILAATFMENGEQLAHELGNLHPGYTHESTQEMWDLKMRTRKERGIGWPSCKKIEEAGCTFCKTCPHHGKKIGEKDMSPLHLAIEQKAVEVRVTPQYHLARWATRTRSSRSGSGKATTPTPSTPYWRRRQPSG